GNGVTQSEASDELRQVAERLGAPVGTTLMAKGVFPEDHAWSVGMTGIWGTRVANNLARSADVILAVGTAFGEADCSSWNPNYTFSIPPTELIQIDIDPQEVGKIYPVAVGLVGDGREDRGAEPAGDGARRRRRLPVGRWRRDDGRRAGDPGGLGDLQQLLLRDDPQRGDDLLQQQLRDRVPDAGRRTVQPGFR